MSSAAMPQPTDAVVADVMSRPVLTVEVDETLWDAWQLLFVSGLRHLVVLDANDRVNVIWSFCGPLISSK